MSHNESPNRSGGRGYEVEDASTREVVFSALGLAVGTIVVCIAVIGLFRVLKNAEIQERKPLTDLAVPVTQPPGPRLQDKPWLELEALRHKEDQTLTTYGWVNKGAGVTRIPIDRAMDIIVQRGLPARTTDTSAPTAPSNSGRPVNPGTNRAGAKATGAKTNAPR